MEDSKTAVPENEKTDNLGSTNAADGTDNVKADKQDTDKVTDAEDNTDDTDNDKKSGKKKIRKLEANVADLTKSLNDANAKLAEQNDRYMRLYAEYDNFRKRSAKEREGVYTDAYADAIKYLLPIIDNLERAANIKDSTGVAEGVAMVLRSAGDAMNKMGITEIECKTFDPNFHNAVMHIEDEQYGENQIVEVLQKGYMRGDKVIRYAMVKVAN